MARILVAEDDEGIRAMVGGLLRHGGHDIVFASNGLEAIEQLQKSDFNAIILDLMMPTASGFEVLAWMHRERRGVSARRVIVLTAMAQQTLTNFSADRVFSVIRKPFDIDELRATVARCVDGVNDD